MVRIGIISDTHGRIPQSVQGVFAGCDHILHAGDVGVQSVLDELETLAPVTAVLGNCDRLAYRTMAGQVAYEARLEFEGVRIFMMHRPQDLTEAVLGRGLLQPAMTPLPHLCVHGHTHIPKNEIAGGYHTVCPGSPVNPRGGSKPGVALLTITEARVLSVELVELYFQP